MRVSGIVKQLKQAREKTKRQLAGIDAALKAFSVVYEFKPGKAQRRMYAGSRTRIAAAQRVRWAKPRN